MYPIFIIGQEQYGRWVDCEDLCYVIVIHQTAPKIYMFVVDIYYYIRLFLIPIIILALCVDF